MWISNGKEINGSLYATFILMALITAKTVYLNLARRTLPRGRRGKREV